MDKKELIAQILNKKSFLCVGLDPDLSRIPSFIEVDDPVFEFNKRIIDATKSIVLHINQTSLFMNVWDQKVVIVKENN